MDLRIKIKPYRVTARTKVELISKITAGKSYTIGTGGSFLSAFGNTDRYVYTIQKYRKKTVQTKNAKDLKTTSEVIRNGYWEAFVYRFPKELPVKVKQKNRNFEIIPI